MTRAEQLTLLSEYTKNQGLIRHMLAVEAALRAYARRLGEDEEIWGMAGLLHDFDYEMYPDPVEHSVKGAEILRGKDCPPEVVRAILTHNEQNGLNLSRETPLEKALVACDELCGMITAVALVRPSKSLGEVTPQSVLKKMKDKAFARQVNREEIRRGAEDFGVELSGHIAFVIEAMKSCAGELGLDGSQSRADG